MAFDTYDDLKEAMDRWLQAEGGLTALIPDFIALAEALFNRRLRTLEMEVRAKLSTEAGTSRYVLPTGHLETRRLSVAIDNERLLQYLTPQDFIDREINVVSGEPRYFTIESDELRISTPDGVYELDQVYFKRIGPLSDAEPTNWLLTQSPDAYLYGSLVHSAPYLEDDPRVAVWEAGHERALRQIEKADRNQRLGGAPLRARSEVTRDSWRERKGA